MRLYESMNWSTARSKAYVAMARRPGNVSVLHWTKNHRIPPKSLIENIYLALAHGTIVDDDGHQRHIEKQISSDLKNSKIITLPI
jgi:hypothetical protein